MNNTTNRDGWVESCAHAMGEEAGTVYGLLCKELWELSRERDTYQALFGAGTADFNLINESAPDFFGLVQRLLFESIALRIEKLAQPASSGNGQQNVTFSKLLQMLDLNLFRFFRPINQTSLSDLDKIRSGIFDLKNLAGPFKVWRHKVIAHSDLKHATEGFPPLFTGNQVEAASSRIHELLSEIGAPFNLSINSQYGWVDVGKLKKHLRAAKPELDRQREIEDSILGI